MLTGVVSLPSSLNLGKGGDPIKVKGRRQEREMGRDIISGSMTKNIEQSLLATCVGSLSELGNCYICTVFFRNESNRSSILMFIFAR